jgi:hypothetical protein
LTTKRIILFRFARDPLVCRSRVALLRKLNPGVPIFGLFGGDAGFKRSALRFAGKRALHLDGLYSSRQSGAWNWKHGDLVVAGWYRDVGYRVDFDVAHLVEWDLVLLEPLERLYESVPDNAVGLTGLTPLSSVEHEWEWMQNAADRRDWEQFLAYARSTWGYEDVPHACLGAGPCFPRAFLAEYLTLDQPTSCVDELRYPLLAQVLGFSIVDTGFCRQWFDHDEARLFNVGGAEIELSTIAGELAKPDGRRAFHPVRRIVRGTDVLPSPR